MKKTFTLWRVHKALSDVLYDSGKRDPRLASQIIAKEVLGDGELTFEQEVEVYRRRRRDDRVLQILMNISAAWLRSGNTEFADFAQQAALKLVPQDRTHEVISEILSRARAY